MPQPKGSTGNWNGRPAGIAEVLPRGTRKLIEAARQAEALGIECDEAWGTILGIMRGEIKTRYLRERLSAACFVLEQKIGKARQRVSVEHSTRDGQPLTTHQVVIAGGSVVPAATAGLPEPALAIDGEN